MTARVMALHRRVVMLVLAAVAFVWCATAVFVYVDARHELNELLDGHLAQAAALILAQSEGANVSDAVHAPALHKYARRVVFQVWERGMLRLHSANAPDAMLSAQSDGFSDGNIGGERWRIFSSRDTARHVVIQVGERYHVREELARDVALNVLHPMLYVLPALGLLLWGAITRGLKPLNDLAAAVAGRNADNLAPLHFYPVPAEAVPLVNALNRLFGRIEQSVAGERRFTSDAAHELRTPVAAIKAQVQVAQTAVDDAERRRALSQAVAACGRAAHLVDQLLVLARLDQRAEVAFTTVDLHAVAMRVLGLCAPYAATRGIELELRPGATARITGNEALLDVLVRNIVDNAIRYSPTGTHVEVDVTVDDAATILTIVDEGPGIAESQCVQVFERFYRGVGNPEPGSGLGLSIVKQIADLHGATVALGRGPEGRGLKVAATFPCGETTKG